MGFGMEEEEQTIWCLKCSFSGSGFFLLSQAEVVPWKLWLAVAFLLLIDVILLTIWTVIDPLGREVRNFAKLASPNPDDDIEILPQLEHCKSKHHKVWLGKNI